MKLALISAGEFLMDNPENLVQSNRNEKPQRCVEISKVYYLGVYEVMRGEFTKFVEYTNYKTEAERDCKGAQGSPAGKWLSRCPKYLQR